MFDQLTEKLQDSIQFLTGQSKISEANIESAIQDIRKALLSADVSLNAVKVFIDRVEKEAYGEKVLRGIKPGEQVVKIINDALIEILGGDPNQEQELSTELNLNIKKGSVNSIMLLGLQGSGKTTLAGKLAYNLKAQGLKILLVPCDLQRPAAIKQLSILAESAGVDFLEIPQTQNLMEVASQAEKQINENKYDGYYKMIGNTKELYNFDSNKKKKSNLYIPLPFYFQNKFHLALPLIALQNSELIFEVNTRNIDELINIEEGASLVSDMKIKFELIGNFIYLSDYERELFSKMRHEYLIEQVQYCHENISENIKGEIKLNFLNPVKDMFFIIQDTNSFINKEYYQYENIFKVTVEYLSV
jgi:energy-coupling factor transporter ATP-binding protein EcfA2